MGVVSREVVTKRQFTCPHCRTVSPEIGVANAIIQGHCDWVSCVNCDKLSRSNVITEAPYPFKVVRQYTYTPDGDVLSCIVVSVTACV